jgi:hypothetical protein
LEGVIGEIAADAKVEEAKALVAGPSLEFTDPIEGLPFAGCAAGSEACNDCRLGLGGRGLGDGVRR